MQMQFRGKLTEADLEDVRRIVRSKWYWPKLLASNWYGVLLLCAVIWATVAGLLGETHPNWRAVGILWVVILGVFGWVFYTTKKGMAKEFSQLNTTLPDWVSLVDDGVKLSGPQGATAFQPWNNYKGWREGKRVMLLDLQGGGFMMLPVADLSEIERDSIRQFLRSHIVGVSTAALAPL
jgi:hypothetical protein